MREAWDLAQLALLLLQVDPHGLGGVWLKSGYSPARQTWLAQRQADDGCTYAVEQLFWPTKSVRKTSGAKRD